MAMQMQWSGAKLEAGRGVTVKDGDDYAFIGPSGAEEYAIVRLFEGGNRAKRPWSLQSLGGYFLFVGTWTECLNEARRLAGVVPAA